MKKIKFIILQSIAVFLCLNFIQCDILTLIIDTYMQFDKSLSETQLIENYEKGTLQYTDVALMMSLELPLLHFAIYKNYFNLFKLVVNEKSLAHVDKIKRSAFEFALLLNSQNTIPYIINHFELKQFNFFPLWCVNSDQLELLKHHHQEFDLTKNYKQRSLLEHLCLKKKSNFNQKMYEFLKTQGVEFNLQNNNNSFFQFIIQGKDYEVKYYMNAILSILEFNPEQVRNKNNNNDNSLHIYFKFLNTQDTVSLFNVDLIKMMLKVTPELVMEKNNDNFLPSQIIKKQHSYAKTVFQLLKETETIFVEKKQLENLLSHKASNIERKEKIKKL